MSLAKGDHLRIQRNGKLIEPDQEAYHEFVVLGSLNHTGALLNYIQHQVAIDEEGKEFTYYDIRVRVVK